MSKLNFYLEKRREDARKLLAKATARIEVLEEENVSLRNRVIGMEETESTRIKELETVVRIAKRIFEADVADPHIGDTKLGAVFCCRGCAIKVLQRALAGEKP